MFRVDRRGKLSSCHGKYKHRNNAKIMFNFAWLRDFETRLKVVHFREGHYEIWMEKRNCDLQDVGYRK